jgi:hypothetical protein
VNIALELNIKLDGTNLQVVHGQGSGGVEAPIDQRENEKVSWQIPDFSSEKIHFGK